MGLAPDLLAAVMGDPAPSLAPTPRDVVLRDGTTRLLRFRGAVGQDGTSAAEPLRGQHLGGGAGLPLLLVPSIINKWYVLDLRAGSSLVEALTAGGIDTFCIDWVGAEAEDRHLTWDDLVGKVARAMRFVLRETGAPRVGLLGYCMGGTLAAIAAALAPSKVAGLVNLAGPIDFAQAGDLRHMVSPEWFDAEAIAGAGNITARQMQDGFAMLRPTLALSKWVGYLDRMHDPKQRLAFAALEAWSSDNVDFPAAAYVTYIEELYQQNLLPRGEHHVAGKRVDLGRITCPVMSAVASHDTICPPAAAYALNDLSGSTDKTILTVTGGHVGAVVGSRAARELYPPMVAWWKKHLATRPAAQETVLHN